MNLLAIETSTEACSAALVCGEDVIERYDLAPQQHAELILPMIDGLLADAGLRLDALEGLAFGRGPGSFTGVRIAASVIQGIALATGLKVAPVSSLAALAQAAYQRTASTCVLAAIDARMGEVYWSAYTLDVAGLMREVIAESVCAPGIVAVPELAQPWFGTGSGWSAYLEPLRRRIESLPVFVENETHFPNAAAVACLGLDAFSRGATVPAEQALPVYLRNRVAEPKR